MAEPYKFTEGVKDQFLGLLRAGNSRKSALEAVDVTRYTLRNHMKSDPEFAKRVLDAESDAIEIVEDCLFEKCLRGNATAIFFYLCNRKPDRWRSINKLQVEAVNPQAIEEMELRFERIIEYCLRYIPEDHRSDFLEGLRDITEVEPSGRQALPAPHSA
jgi:hypothetical protein